MKVREGDKGIPNRELYLQSERSSGEDLKVQLKLGLEGGGEWRGMCLILRAWTMMLESPGFGQK